MLMLALATAGQNAFDASCPQLSCRDCNKAKSEDGLTQFCLAYNGQCHSASSLSDLSAAGDFNFELFINPCETATPTNSPTKSPTSTDCSALNCIECANARSEDNLHECMFYDGNCEDISYLSTLGSNFDFSLAVFDSEACCAALSCADCADARSEDSDGVMRHDCMFYDGNCEAISYLSTLGSNFDFSLAVFDSSRCCDRNPKLSCLDCPKEKKDGQVFCLNYDGRCKSLSDLDVLTTAGMLEPSLLHRCDSETNYDGQAAQSTETRRRATTDGDGQCSRHVHTYKTVQVPCTRNTYKRRLDTDGAEDGVLRRLTDEQDEYDDCVQKVQSFKTVQVPCTRNRYTVDGVCEPYTSMESHRIEVVNVVPKPPQPFPSGGGSCEPETKMVSIQIPVTNVVPQPPQPC